MNIKKLGSRAAIVGILTATLTGFIGIAGSSTALACGAPTEKSHSYAATLPQVRPGQFSSTVLALQLNLRANGYQLNGTGYYGSATLTAVRDFQRKNGIKDSGIVGSRTWHKLVGSLAADLTLNGGFTPPAQGMRPGYRGEAVAYLNNALMRIHPYSAAQMEHGNHYGPNTVAMVKDFQRRNGIKASGIVGPKTWAALNRVVSVSGGWGC